MCAVRERATLSIQKIYMLRTDDIVGLHALLQRYMVGMRDIRMMAVISVGVRAGHEHGEVVSTCRRKQCREQRKRNPKIHRRLYGSLLYL